MFKSIVKPSAITFLLVFMFVNLIYGFIHYGFGKVVIPEWYMNDNERYLLQATPINEFISYWINRGLTFSFTIGFIAFILVFVFTTYQYRRHIVANGKY